MAGQQFGRTDTLDGFTEAHVICQNRPPDPGGKGDAVHLVGKQFGIQQGLAQSVFLGVLADFGDRFGHALLKQLLMDVFFGIRINDHFGAEAFYPAHAADQPFYVLNRFSLVRCQVPGDLGGKILRNQQAKLQAPTVAQVYTNVFDFGRCFPDGLFEFFPDFIQGIYDVFAGSESIFAEIRARTERLPRLPASQGNSITFSGCVASDGVVGPQLMGIHGI